VRVLLLGPGREIGNEIVTLGGGGQDLAIPRVDHHSLGGLRSAINADQKTSHKLFLSNAKNEEPVPKFNELIRLHAPLSRARRDGKTDFSQVLLSFFHARPII
jgi:hypothetical protein